jgi:hypothetical protein
MDRIGILALPGSGVQAILNIFRRVLTKAHLKSEVILGYF